MSFLYHLYPKPMIGDHLCPLYELKDFTPEQYDFHKKKYLGREQLMQTIIPQLDCKWNEVLHFSPINPQIILSHLRRVNPKIVLKRNQYIRFKAELFDSLPAVVMRFGSNQLNTGFDINKAEIDIFSSNKYFELQEVPSLTQQYWQLAFKKNQPLLWYYYIPHIFVKSRLDIRLGEIFDFT